jgi:hypothetical protein
MSRVFARPKARAKHKRSTAGQIAELTNTSHHKAAQAIRVIDKPGPELVKRVERGEISLREA